MMIHHRMSSTALLLTTSDGIVLHPSKWFDASWSPSDERVASINSLRKEGKTTSLVMLVLE